MVSASKFHTFINIGIMRNASSGSWKDIYTQLICNSKCGNVKKMENVMQAG